MNRHWLIFILGAIGFFMIYELLNNGFTVFLLVSGIVTLLLSSRVDEKKRSTWLLIGIGAIALAIFSSRVVLILLILLLVILVGQFPELFQTARESFKKSQDSRKNSEFVMVHFAETEKDTAKVIRNRWIGNEDQTTDEIYSWSDVNYTKLIGNTVFDLGNTILPKEQNIILIRKGLGNTKILVPEEVAISLDVSILLGELNIGQEGIPLKNETFKWKSEKYEKSARKIKLVANVLVGEVEVVFL